MSMPGVWPMRSVALILIVVGVGACETAANLHQAAAGGDLEQVRQLVNSGASPLARDAQGLSPRNHAELFGHSAVFQYLLVAEALDGEAVMRIPRPPTFAQAAYANRHISRLLGNTQSEPRTDSLNVEGLLALQAQQEVVFPEESMTPRLQLEFWISDPVLARSSAVAADCHVCTTRLWRDPRVGLNRASVGGCKAPDEIGSAHAVAVLNADTVQKNDWVEIVSRHGKNCPSLPP